MARKDAQFDKDLRRIYHVINKTTPGFATMTARMQELYPGNYIVEECFRTDLLTWGPRLRFNDEQEELIFMLRYS